MFRRKQTVQADNVPTPSRPEDLAPERCYNCGAMVTSKFCAECGQEHSQKVLSIWRLVADFLEGAFSLDSKVARTLGRLLFMPGLLTEEYNQGRRVRYLSPFRLYLFASALVFYLMSAQVTRLDIGGAAMKGSGGAKTIGETMSAGGSREPKSVAEYEAQQMRLPPDQRDNALVHSLSEKRLSLRNQRIVDVVRRERQGALENAPKAMFLLLPVFALLLKLIYLRRRRLYIEHLVFALHCHAFIFTLLCVPLAWGALGHSVPGWLNNSVVVAIAVYLLVAMKRVYRQGWGKTMLKLGILSAAYTLLLACVGAGVLVYTFLTS